MSYSSYHHNYPAYSTSSIPGSNVLRPAASYVDKDHATTAQQTSASDEGKKRRKGDACSTCKTQKTRCVPTEGSAEALCSKHKIACSNDPTTSGQDQTPASRSLTYLACSRCEERGFSCTFDNPRKSATRPTRSGILAARNTQNTYHAPGDAPVPAHDSQPGMAQAVFQPAHEDVASVDGNNQIYDPASLRYLESMPELPYMQAPGGPGYIAPSHGQNYWANR
ncbi:uncharacterized protein I303_103023 [Kwoniella dejecticola CBS 10117]|uniref:Uncharacterized protein n=1 Tax=Kwoniella dejecticola CBS 10117 TaxID=1296121 RepID=A0A1A6AAD9_9TREE|nr:uncharacterized protein I303_03043 [Kwoniella dejecticola CBS 10117]OBR87021.1 hypothetical protein I303_03043 [Kwoniella dejecticola CBS 10117]